MILNLDVVYNNVGIVIKGLASVNYMVLAR
jgi:hypothetical protein